MNWKDDPKEHARLWLSATRKIMNALDDSAQRGAVTYERTMGLIQTLGKAGFAREARQAREYIQKNHSQKNNLRRAMREAGMGW